MRRYRATADRILRVILLQAYLCAAFGLRLDLAAEQARVTDSSVPFPCQNGHCGCSSAAECWSDCCCLTPKQRIEWAKKNGVAPPYELIGRVDDDAAVSKSDAMPVLACCGGPLKSGTCCGSTKGRPKHVGFKIKSRSCQGKESRWLASTIDVIPVSIVDSLRDDTQADSVCVMPFAYRPHKSQPASAPPEVQVI